MAVGGTVMLNQLALSSLMVVITVMVHLIGLTMVMRLLRSTAAFIPKLRITPLILLAQRVRSEFSPFIRSRFALRGIVLGLTFK
jgi:hypothetical protein